MFTRPVADQQILRGVAATLSWQPTDATGEPAAPAGTVTVGVTKADGTTVVAAATSTSGSGSSPRTYALAAQNALELLTVTWTDGGDSSTAVQLVEVVGGYWFTLAQAAARDEKLADQTKYPPDRVLAVRAEVEAEFEEVTKQAWVPRYRRETIRGSGHAELVLSELRPRTVRSVRAYDPDGVTYDTWSAGDIAELTLTDHGTLRRPDGATWARNSRYVVEYEHGHDRPPADLRDAAITRLRHRLNSHRSGIPDRATTLSTEGGQTFALATPGLRGFVTGIPDVDVVLGRYTFQTFGVA